MYLHCIQRVYDSAPHISGVDHWSFRVTMHHYTPAALTSTHRVHSTYSRCRWTRRGRSHTLDGWLVKKNIAIIFRICRAMRLTKMWMLEINSMYVCHFLFSYLNALVCFNTIVCVWVWEWNCAIAHHHRRHHKPRPHESNSILCAFSGLMVSAYFKINITHLVFT